MHERGKGGSRCEYDGWPKEESEEDEAGCFVGDLVNPYRKRADVGGVAGSGGGGTRPAKRPWETPRDGANLPGLYRAR